MTGIILLIYYVPHPDHAFRSVQDIMTKVPYGWLFREMHAVGSNLIITVILLHMVVVFLMGNYKQPRELTWLGEGFHSFSPSYSVSAVISSLGPN